MPNQSRKQDYHAALHLNNIGVELIEHGGYKEALVSLKDSLIVMKSAFPFHSGPGSISGAGTRFHVQRRLERAKRWIEQGKITEPLADNDVQAGISIEVYEYKNRFISQLLAEENPVYSVFHATVIDHPEDQTNFTASGRDPDLEIVVIICNLSLSYYLVSGSLFMESHKVAAELLRQAHNLFNLAFDIVSNRFALCDDYAEESRLTTVALLLTSTAMKISQETGQVAHAAELREKHDRLRRTAMSHKVFDQGTGASSACANE